MNIPYILSELQRAGLTQTQIGKAIGLKQSTVSDMAAGKAGTKRPSYQTISGLERLAAEHQVGLAPPPTESQPQ